MANVKYDVAENYFIKQIAKSGVVYKFYSDCNHRRSVKGHSIEGLLCCNRRNAMRMVKQFTTDIYDLNPDKPVVKFLDFSSKMNWFFANPNCKKYQNEAWFDGNFFSQMVSYLRILEQYNNTSTWQKKGKNSTNVGCQFEFKLTPYNPIYINTIKKKKEKELTFQTKQERSTTHNTPHRVFFFRQIFISLFNFHFSSLKPNSKKMPENFGSIEEALIFAQEVFKDVSVMKKERGKVLAQARKAFKPHIEVLEDYQSTLEEFADWYCANNETYHQPVCKKAADTWIRNRIDGKHKSLIEFKEKTQFGDLELDAVESAVVESWGLVLTKHDKRICKSITQRFCDLGMIREPKHAEVWTKRFLSRVGKKDDKKLSPSHFETDQKWQEALSQAFA